VKTVKVALSEKDIIDAIAASFIGYITPQGVEVVSKPKWDDKEQRWTSLANVNSALCLVEWSLSFFDTGNSA